MIRRLLVLILITFSLAPASRAETEVGNVYCPVEPSEAALPEYSAEHEGKKVYFCCSECVELFQGDPQNYLADDGSESADALRSVIDHAWNRASRTPALSIGGLVIAALLAGRLAIPRLRPLLGAQTFTIVAALALGAEAIWAHQRREQEAAKREEAELIHRVHFSTYHEYGDPPIPERPDISPRLSATFYRGNDERSDQLFNGGYYRTCDFELDLCDAGGRALTYGDSATPDDLFLRVRVVRAPGTPDFFWTPDRMANIFASRSAAKLLGRDGATVPDAVPMAVLRPMWEWEMRYPLAPFAGAAAPGRLAGIVYHCEKRFGADDQQIGSRFHYAFQFDLAFAETVILPGSDLWMGSTYRNRVLRIWEIPQREWLSSEPIPLIDGENLTTDPKLLGIEGHVLDQN